VAFMLEHCFWLLEFKFKFEFHCLNPFQTPKPKFLNPIPKTPTLFPIQPIRPRSPTRAQQQPRSPPAASRPPPRASQPAAQPAQLAL
jgi:hypothetical protein